MNAAPQNPLLHYGSLPHFGAITVDMIEPALDHQLAANRQRIAALLASPPAGGWDWRSLVAPLEQWDDELSQLWSTVSHLYAVRNSDALREVYDRCLPKLTAYNTELGQHRGLFEAFQALAASPVYAALDTAQRKVVDNALRDFTLSGIALEGAARERYGQIKQRLAELSTRFSNNVLDATQGWSKHIEDIGQLAGIPETALALYRQAARAKGLDGWLIGLDLPAYLPAMQYADNAALREELYRAYTTRASEQGLANNGQSPAQWDNSAVIDETLALRHELAQLLGFANYAERSLATKMAESSAQVMGFLEDLALKTRPVASNDYRELADFAAAEGVELQAWDVPYYSEKLRLAKYALSQQELRPYFPVDTVINGLFEIVGRLFGIRLVAQSGFDSYHPDARLYQLLRGDQLIAHCYLDLFARENKRGGAWMADCRVRRRTLDGELQLPVAYLTCNFTPSTAEQPSLLTHNEVTTLFHEFGHGLHHMLTAVECAGVSGINGVAWDAVELPSQFLENWCWEPAALPLISGHYQSGEPLPASLLDKMLAARNFQSGMQMVRQLEFALFDFALHLHYQADQPAAVQSVLDRVREQVGVYPLPSFNRFQHSFSHIFAGGYAAGYYSYKWAEVLSADAFSLFEQRGIFDRATGDAFLQHILQRGGEREPMELFKAFRGREPRVDALLRHSGIVTAGDTDVDA